MRQAFIDAVNSLPVFSERQINNICPFFDSEREKKEVELRKRMMDGDKDEHNKDDPLKFAGENKKLSDSFLCSDLVVASDSKEILDFTPAYKDFQETGKYIFEITY